MFAPSRRLASKFADPAQIGLALAIIVCIDWFK